MLKSLPYQNIYCIGIGGIGVSGLAELLHRLGYQVSGADLSSSRLTQHLQSLGITVFSAHQADQIGDADLVVYTSAVNEQNPEMRAAKAKGVPTLSRGEVLARVMQADYNMIVTGTHGKTTTTALASYVFEQAEAKPTCLIGGVLQDRCSPLVPGDSHIFIAEADESDASFLFLSPTVAVITNIDLDHMETYAHNFDQLKQSFLSVAHKIPSHGFVVACIDDPTVRELIPEMGCRVLTYGTAADADYRLTNYQQHGLKSCFHLSCQNEAAYTVTLAMPGVHNALNAVAALVMAHQLQLDMKKAVMGLASFPGVGRRFQYRGEIELQQGAALLFDDYGHHPIEIKATLSAARLAWPERRLVLVFQPHRYSRTRDLMPDFVDVLKDVDQLVLTEVYAASEERILGADGSALFASVQAAGGKNPHFVEELQALPAYLREMLQEGDVVILQGAGNIVTMAEELLSM